MGWGGVRRSAGITRSASRRSERGEAGIPAGQYLGPPLGLPVLLPIVIG
jgi:hypothetical protein